jgi:trehalose 6-phosphate phosphatase
MIGDDLPDETALVAAERLGGRGLRVAGEHFNQGADFNGPVEVREWLEQSAGVTE